MSVVPLPHLLSEAEAAARLGVSKDTMQRERKRGRMPYRRIGGRIKYTEDDLLTYIRRSGENQCPTNDPDRSETIGSAGDQGARSGTEPGSIGSLDRHAASALARRTFRTRSSDSLNGSSPTPDRETKPQRT